MQRGLSFNINSATLYNTKVVEQLNSHTLLINHGSWHTRSTCKAINTFLERFNTPYKARIIRGCLHTDNGEIAQPVPDQGLKILIQAQ